MHKEVDGLTAAELHARIGTSWPDVLVQLGIPEPLGTKKSRPCPMCGGRDRFVCDNRRNRGDYLCRGCGAGDGFDLLAKFHGWDFTETRHRVIKLLGLDGERAVTFDEAVVLGRRGAPKGNRNAAKDEDENKCSNITFESRGTTTDYTLARLKRDHPELAQEVIDGKRSANSAAMAGSDVVDWSGKAQFIWEKTTCLRGTLGEVYLRARGCAFPPIDGDLRFLPASDNHPPTLCARITDALTGKPTSLHFTALTADGAQRGERRLLGGHRKRGGLIRLWPAEAVNSGLAIAEGIESALAAAHAFKPVWAAIDAGNLATLPVLPGIEALTIIADHDDAGIRAAQQCAERWADSRREVRIAKPRTKGADAADVAMRAA